MQGNIHRSKTAREILSQLCLERNIDLLIISEQYQNENNSNWFSDTLGTAAIWIKNPSKFIIKDYGAGEGFVWVKDEITIISCYFTSNEPVSQFESKLQNLEDVIQNMNGEIIIAGDFNAKAPEWGMDIGDSRGRRIINMIARLDLIILNKGKTPTFRRAGNKGTIPDISLSTGNIGKQIKQWTVIEDFTASDHQYINFEVCSSNKMKEKKEAKHLRTVKFSLGMYAVHKEIERNSNAETVVNSGMKLLSSACDMSMPRMKPRGTKRSMYWWTNEISNLRKKCLRLRRISQ